MSETEFPGWIQVIANVGFPIAVTSYLLLRFEKKIDDVSSAINDLIEVINLLEKKGGNK